jgi:hypothetical protein
VRGRARAAIAVALAAAAAATAAVAHDAAAWRDALARGDAAFARAPRTASWDADTLLPGDPVGAILRLRDDVELRSAVRAFVIAERMGRGFDNGAARSRARAQAAATLADASAGRNPLFASQASDLLGVLAATGAAAGGFNDEEGARAAFDTSIRSNLDNRAAKTNLEILLRRNRLLAGREGAGRGSARRGGAGASTTSAGRGY